MSLDQGLHLVTYACVLAFVISVVARAVKLARLPTHVRWELYPVAHEKGKAHYGGSYFEELDWWTKERETSLVGEAKVMIPEIFLLAGVRHKNPSQWLRSFPFHFGLYLAIVATVLLLVGGIVAAAGGSAPWLLTLTAITAYGGFGLGLLGAAALFVRRIGNVEYREYTAPADFFNLLFFVVTFAIALVAQIAGDADFSRMQGFFAGLVTFGGCEAAGISGLQAVAVVLLSLLAAHVPLTHMSHFFTKYFMYHDIRWSDEPLVRGGKLEKKMLKNLAMKPTWSAPHIRGDGKKTWLDIATSSGEETEEEVQE